MRLDRLLNDWTRRRGKLDPELLRRAKPLRNPDVTEEEGPAGLLLSAPFGGKSWMQKFGAPTKKTFELEEIGSLVWSLCDGDHTFEAISRKLKEEYKMNRLEADASLAAYLQTLTQRGLITMLVPKKR